ncbi:hypothetical protein PJ267_20585 [Arthrobacter sp. OVS8]|nr:hypothetical protein PJ267_20585 [Arthrobacter sp. OVS8]
MGRHSARNDGARNDGDRHDADRNDSARNDSDRHDSDRTVEDGNGPVRGERAGQRGVTAPAGARVLVARSPDRAAELVTALRDVGAEPCCCRSLISNSPATSTPWMWPSTPSVPVPTPGWWSAV